MSLRSVRIRARRRCVLVAVVALAALLVGGRAAEAPCSDLGVQDFPAGLSDFTERLRSGTLAVLFTRNFCHECIEANRALQGASDLLCAYKTREGSGAFGGLPPDFALGTLDYTRPKREDARRLFITHEFPRLQLYRNQTMRAYEGPWIAARLAEWLWRWGSPVQSATTASALGAALSACSTTVVLLHRGPEHDAETLRVFEKAALRVSGVIGGHEVGFVETSSPSAVHALSLASPAPSVAVFRAGRVPQSVPFRGAGRGSRLVRLLRERAHPLVFTFSPESYVADCDDVVCVVLFSTDPGGRSAQDAAAVALSLAQQLEGERTTATVFRAEKRARRVRFARADACAFAGILQQLAGEAAAFPYTRSREGAAAAADVGRDAFAEACACEALRGRAGARCGVALDGLVLFSPSVAAPRRHQMFFLDGTRPPSTESLRTIITDFLQYMSDISENGLNEDVMMRSYVRQTGFGASALDDDDDDDDEDDDDEGEGEVGDGEDKGNNNDSARSGDNADATDRTDSSRQGAPSGATAGGGSGVAREAVCPQAAGGDGRQSLRVLPARHLFPVLPADQPSNSSGYALLVYSPSCALSQSAAHVLDAITEEDEYGHVRLVVRGRPAVPMMRLSTRDHLMSVYALEDAYPLIRWRATPVFAVWTQGSAFPSVFAGSYARSDVDSFLQSLPVE